MRISEHQGISSGSAAKHLIELLLDRTPVAIALCDRDMRYVAYNDRWITDYDLPDKDLIGCSHYDVFPQIGEEWRSLHQRALAGETLSRDRDPYPGRDGQTDWIRWTMAPWTDEAGQVQGILIVTEMLTSQIEEELRTRILTEEMSLFHEIAEGMALFMLDEAGRIMIWKVGAQRMFGWSEAEVLGKSFEFIFDPADKTRGLPERQLEVARAHGSFHDRCWRLRKDGSRFLGDVTVSHIEGNKLLPGGYGVIIRDVTSEDNQARSLEASSVLLRSILDTVPDAMIVIDDNGIILSFSRTAELLFGYDREEVIGKNVSMLMPSPDAERHDFYMSRYRETGKAHIIGNKRRVLGLRKGGTIFPHTLRVGEAYGGGQRMFAGFLHDLTETEKAEARLNELQRELSHIARVSEMGTLATAMAHELNQPLMAIGNLVQTSSELLKEDRSRKILDQVTGALEEAGRQAMRAGAIVKRLRRFVSRGELDRTIEDPGSLVRDTCELIESDAKFRDIEFSVFVADGVREVLVDRVQVQQVLLNLVRNATDAIGKEGQVRISARPDGPMMEFMVWDSGPGVPPERVGRLFEPFATTKTDGMGLGLSICKTIIEAHGGKIWYAAGDSGGASFIFTVPQVREGKVDDD